MAARAERRVQDGPAAGRDLGDGDDTCGGFGEAPGQGGHAVVQPDLHMGAEIAYGAELRPAVVEVAPVGPVVQVEAPGEETGLHGAVDPAVGVHRALCEHPGVHGLQNRLAGRLRRVVPAGEPGGVDAPPGVVDQGGHAGGELGGHLHDVDVQFGARQVLGEAGDARRVDAPRRAVQVPPELQGVALHDFEQPSLDGVVEALAGGYARVVEVVGAGQRTQLALAPVEVGEGDRRPAGPAVLRARCPECRCVGGEFGVRKSWPLVLPGGVRGHRPGPVQPQALRRQLGGRGPAGCVGVAGRRDAVAAVAFHGLGDGGDPGALKVPEGGAERDPVGRPGPEAPGVGDLGGHGGVAGRRAGRVLDGLDTADQPADGVDQGFDGQGAGQRHISGTGST